MAPVVVIYLYPKLSVCFYTDDCQTPLLDRIYILGNRYKLQIKNIAQTILQW